MKSDLNNVKEVQYAPLTEDEIIDIVRFEKNINKDRNKEVYLLAFEKE